MAPRNEKVDPDAPKRLFVPGLRSILYATTFFFLFAFTVAELGLVSQQLHKYGNTYQHYASMEYKNGLGLLLAAVIVSLLFTIFHYWTSVGFSLVVSLALAVMFGTGAGIIQRTTPFKGTSCHSKPVSDYPDIWQPYAHECSRIVSIQAVGWALWALYIMYMIGTIVYKVGFRVKPTPGGYYSV
jgi:hypothetical protein